MKTYKITYTEKLIHEFYVEAEDEHRAARKFDDMLNHGEVDFSDGCLVNSSVKLEEVK